MSENEGWDVLVMRLFLVFECDLDCFDNLFGIWKCCVFEDWIVVDVDIWFGD